MKIFFLQINNAVYKIFTMIVCATFLSLAGLINCLNFQGFLFNSEIQLMPVSHKINNLQYFNQDVVFINFPNPFKYLTYIYIRLPRVNNCNVKIYDLFGNVVKTYELTGKQEYILEWDGRNDIHEKVAKGTYICVLSYGNLKLVRKIGFIR